MSERTGSFADLRRTAGWHFFAIAFLGRLPVAMNIVGVLTMVAIARDSLAEAGIASATLGVASGIGGPLLGAAADRWGQRRVLTTVAVLNAAALTGIVSAAYADVPLGVLVAACLAAGVTSPQISPLARARWMSLLAGGDRHRARLAAAMSYEGMADELSFVGGPVLVGILAVTVGPAVPVLVAAGVTVVFVIAFAWHPTAAAVRPSRSEARRAHDHAQRDTTRLPARVLFPIGGMFFMGAFFGAALVAVTAFMQQRGLEEQTGLVYGCLGITSAISALLVVRLPERFTLASRWFLATLVLVVAAGIMVFAGALWAMVVVLLLIGAATGLLLVTLNSIGALIAPVRRMALTMTLISSGITVGQALAAALTGSLAESGGFTAAALCLIVIAIASAALSGSHELFSRRTTDSHATSYDPDLAASERLEGEPA